ncbi:MAG: murein biosynthesis integral membrane protein MurJ [Mycobacteriales bacterium]
MTSGAAGSTARRIARAALLIAVLTVLARVAGLLRILVFARTVGQNCLGDTYQTVNTIPNIIFEIVAGGALSALVVPLLAGAVDAGRRDEVDRIASALFTWVGALLLPLTLLVAAAAGPLAHLLLAGKSCAGGDGGHAATVGAHLLVVFAPQILLYGWGVVLTGVLQAHHRFAWPALAPLLSSLVVVGAYLLYAARTPNGVTIGTVSGSSQAILGVGTTLGVAALTVPLFLPARRAGVRLRLTFRFPDGVAGRARRLAGAAVLAVLGQQAATGVTLWLANHLDAPESTATLAYYAQTVYLLPWAVLAVPLATSAYPTLAARHAAGDHGAYARTGAATGRAVLLVSFAAAAALVAVAVPAARVIVQSAPGRPSVTPLAAGIVAFAPGLVGYGLLALLSRALYARGEVAAPARATLAGWLVAIAASAVAALALPARDRVAALGLGNTVGMTVVGVLLVLAVRRVAGPAVLAGYGRVVLAGSVGAVLAGAAGRGTAAVLGGGGPVAAVLAGLVAGFVTLAVYGLISAATARRELRALKGGLIRHGGP